MRTVRRVHRNHCKSDKEFVEDGKLCGAALCSGWWFDDSLIHVGSLSAITSFARELRASVSVIALLWGLGCAQPSFAQSLPTGGTVASGNVSISSTSPTSLTISQSTATGIVTWSSFSIGQAIGPVRHGTGATLNRVTGNVPSSINGVLSATGRFTVNPSGVVVGPSGEIKTGGNFVASTLDVKDAEFLAGGPLTFSGNSAASVVNLGKSARRKATSS